MASDIVSNIADVFIDYIISHTCNYASPHGSIYYIIALKVHMWYTIVLWGIYMYMFYSSLGPGISVDSTPAMQLL